MLSFAPPNANQTGACRPEKVVFTKTIFFTRVTRLSASLQVSKPSVMMRGTSQVLMHTYVEPRSQIIRPISFQFFSPCSKKKLTQKKKFPLIYPSLQYKGKLILRKFLEYFPYTYLTFSRQRYHMSYRNSVLQNLICDFINCMPCLVV